MTTLISKQSVVIIGFPNSGKTSLFNILTGSTYKTVNYPGSTVDYAMSNYQVSSNRILKMIDTPGLRSFNAKSDDEDVTLNILHSELMSASSVHVMMVLDQTQLLRQLVLAYSFSQLGIPMTVVLTQKDRAEQMNIQVDCDALSSRLGSPVIALNTRLDSVPDSFVDYLKDIPYSNCNNSDLTWLAQLKKRSVIDNFAWTELTLKQVMCQNTKQGFDLDRIFLHPVLGGVCFLMIMWGLFWVIFALASPMMGVIDDVFVTAALAVQSVLPAGFLSQFISDGIITGFGAFLVFTPQIFLLFFLMGILEETGYLARGAVIVDKPLSMVGLSGKSFVPLLSGCACAIPAMMAARTIGNSKERLITLFIIPLMTCSARLPVYGLLIALLFSSQSKWSGIAFTGIYVGSLVLASVTAAIVGRYYGFKKCERKGGRFDMTLPAWHWPKWRRTVRYSVYQTGRFCKDAGPIILGLSIIIWGLSTFPSPEQSMMHGISGWLDPFFRPMGIDGRIGMGLLMAFVAREVFVSAIALVFAVSEENTVGLIDQLTQATLVGTETPLLTPSSIVGLILFFMIAMQCMSTLAVAKQESGSWRLPVVMMGVYTVSAYVLSVIVVQGLRLFGIT